MSPALRRQGLAIVATLAVTYVASHFFRAANVTIGLVWGLHMLTQNAPLTIGLAKAAAREIAKPESKQDHAKLEKMAEACFDSDDFKEGRRAFMEKRKPDFSKL